MAVEGFSPFEHLLVRMTHPTGESTTTGMYCRMCTAHHTPGIWGSKQAIAQEANSTKRSGTMMQKGEKLVIVGCSGAGGPAAMMAKKLMPEVAVTVVRKEPGFIVR
jgi:hypothetical protein